MENYFSDSQIYVEFHEMSGIGYRTLEAKQSKLLKDNCIVAVTLHSGHEWVFEANEKYLVDNPEMIWQVSGYEQFCFENANLSFHPSNYLTTRVKAFGWETENSLKMPNYIPIIGNIQK